jgi:phage shock protein E
MTPSISAAALLARITSGSAPAIVDVRSEREFVDGHVPGAVNVPFLHVSKYIAAIPTGRDAELVVYCGHGPRAMIAARSLRKHGFSRITYLEGHFSKWRSAGLREERV